MEDEQLWTGYVRSSRYEVQVDSEGWAAAAAQSLEHNGFCVLRSPGRDDIRRCVAPVELCARCMAVALSELDRLLKAISKRGIDPIRDVFNFREVCKRHGGARYDVALPHVKPPAAAAAAAAAAAGAEPPVLQAAGGSAADPGDAVGPWPELQSLVDATVQQVVAETRALQGAAVDRAGCVVSYPGTPAQQLHTDGGSPGFFNCFVPLTPVDASNGTELLPGTHEPVEFALVELPWQDESQMEPLTPSLAPGELLLFDYRLRHRGLSNTTAAPRPVAYFVYTRPGLSDTRNFPSQSVYA